MVSAMTTYPFKTADIRVRLEGTTPTFEFASDAGDVRFVQCTLSREDQEQPVWSIVADNPPLAYEPEADQPIPETSEQLLEAMSRDYVHRLASGQGSIAVRALRYGDCPRGFRQQRPPQGPPPLLTAGSYFMQVSGEFNGTATFAIHAMTPRHEPHE